MNKITYIIVGIIIISIAACNDDDFVNNVEIPQFNFPLSVQFEDSLSSYSIFDGNPSDLNPNSDFQLLELSSVLFTDYSKKQRLVKVPEGAQMTRSNDGSILFPDGTILAKTFYYYHDERDESLGKRIIETRLMIKENDLWNVATYVWNDTQTNASLNLDGLDTQLNWVNANGNSITTMYHVPTEDECIACHQSNSNIIPLGTKLRNLNRMVDRNGTSLNQIEHLQVVGVFNNFNVNDLPQIADYKDINASLNDRARAYLDMNCAHCHNPNAWEIPARQDLDLRYETSLNQSGILGEQADILDFVAQGEMPFIGTTILDDEGVNLIVEFIESL